MICLWFMIDNKLKFFFKNQIWHIGGLVILFYLGYQMVDFENNLNVFLGISAKNWFLFLWWHHCFIKVMSGYAGGQNYVGRLLVKQ